jgi:hypothetical protein
MIEESEKKKRYKQIRAFNGTHSSKRDSFKNFNKITKATSIKLIPVLTVLNSLPYGP